MISKKVTTTAAKTTSTVAKALVSGNKPLNPIKNQAPLQTKASDTLTKARTRSTDFAEEVKGSTSSAKLLKSPNYQFYMNEIASYPNGTLVETILEKWKGDYVQLEKHHSYIQWLFPNYYSSKFNDEAEPLSREEAVEFRTNPTIAIRLVRAYELILDFYGMTLDRSTGKISRSAQYKDRYRTLLCSPHNHLRMRRILMHLNNVGFRRYAIELVKFLDKEVNGDNSKSAEEPPLKKLAKSPNVQILFAYGDHGNDPKKKKDLDTNCFAKSEEDYAESVFFIL
jgi:hypothetical protein